MVRKFKVLLTKEAQQYKTLQDMILFLKESGLRADAIFISKNHEFFCSCVGINADLPNKVKLSYTGMGGLYFTDWDSQIPVGEPEVDLKKAFSSAKEKHSEVLHNLYKFWQREVLFYLPEILDTSFGGTFSCPIGHMDIDGINISYSKDFFNSDNLAEDVFRLWPVTSGTGKYISTTQVIRMISKILEIKIKNLNSSTEKINSEIFGSI